MERYNLKQKSFAEFVGTFILVFIGTGLIIVDNVSGGKVTHAGVAVGFGVAVTMAILLVGRVSGANINPAVTFSLVLLNKLEKKNLFPYWAAQILGAIFASVALRLLFGNVVSLGATMPNSGVFNSFLVELLIGFILMIVVCLASFNDKINEKVASFCIGFSVFVLAYFAGPLSGGSINPARSIGPALVSGNILHLWIYILAPFIGFSLAALTYKKLKKE